LIPTSAHAFGQLGEKDMSEEVVSEVVKDKEK
jgi:hypothetical protein